MIKKTIILLLIVLFGGAVFAGSIGVIEMKDGKVYKCKITDYDGGIYTIDENGAQYKIKEAEVKQIGWESDGNDETGVTPAGDGSCQEKEVYFVLEPAALYYFFAYPEEAAVFKNGMLLYGLDVGADFGNRDWRYNAGLMFLTGEGTGELTYSDFLAPGTSKKTAISTRRFLLQCYYKKVISPFSALPLAFSLKMGAGGGINDDVISSYPGANSYYPGGIYYSRMEKAYLCGAAFATAGVMYYLNRNWVVAANAGYQLVTARTYSDSSLTNSYDNPYEELFNSRGFGGLVAGVSMEARL